jgi:CheY-like chemotaxis protein
LNRLSEEIQPTLLAVLSDINMPGVDGLELLAEIKQRFPNLPAGHEGDRQWRQRPKTQRPLTWRF